MKQIIEKNIPSGAIEFTLDLPVGAQILCLRTHGPQPMLVALGEVKEPPKDPKEEIVPLPTTKRTFVLQTNSLLAARRAKLGPVPDGARYVGWFDLGNAPWYVFETTAKAEVVKA